MDAIYPTELEIKETIDSPRFVNFVGLRLEIDNRKLVTSLFDKRDDFDFNIVNYPFLSSNIPSSPAYCVFVSQLIRYSRSSSDYSDFVKRSSNLVTKLLNQGFSLKNLKNSFKKCYGCHHIVTKYDRSMSSITNDIVGV